MWQKQQTNNFCKGEGKQYNRKSLINNSIKSLNYRKRK